MEVKTKDFKELEIILSDFDCDKGCPYCTAKTTRWDKVEDDIYTLFMNVGQMKELGYTFHYVTIGGNGEPTLHSYQKLKDIVEMFDDWDIPVKRVLTSGNIFRPSEKKKYDLFVEHNWMFEVTTTSIDNKIDRGTLGYDHNYFETEAFKKARIRLNYVMLNRNRHIYRDEIQQFAEKYPNIETIGIKLLNINTKTDGVDNPISKWIVDNAVSKCEAPILEDELNIFEYVGSMYDTYSWRLKNGCEIYLSSKKAKYGSFDLVYYGNKFITYHLEDIKLSNYIPKVYIASRFIRKDNPDGTFNLNDDFRAQLIGNHSLTDYNNTSFIRDKSGKIKYQYIGPFYNEKASNGEVTSTDCQEVVNTENKLIEKCDVFIAYFDELLSPGGITELIYAALLNKNIIILFKQDYDVKYSLKTTNWYPITFALTKADNVYVYGVKDDKEAMSEIISIE